MPLETVCGGFQDLLGGLARAGDGTGQADLRRGDLRQAVPDDQVGIVVQHHGCLVAVGADPGDDSSDDRDRAAGRLHLAARIDEDVHRGQLLAGLGTDGEGAGGGEGYFAGFGRDLAIGGVLGGLQLGKLDLLFRQPFLGLGGVVIGAGETIGGRGLFARVAEGAVDFADVGLDVPALEGVVKEGFRRGVQLAPHLVVRRLVRIADGVDLAGDVGCRSQGLTQRQRREGIACSFDFGLWS